MLPIENSSETNVSSGGASNNHVFHAVASGIQDVVERDDIVVGDQTFTHVSSTSSTSRDYRSVAPLERWHLRMRHVSLEFLRKLHKRDQDINKRHVETLLSAGESQATGVQQAQPPPVDAMDLDSLDNIGSTSSKPFREVLIASGEIPLVRGFSVPHDKQHDQHKCDTCRQANIQKKGQLKHSKYSEMGVLQGRVFSTDLKSVKIKSFFGHRYVICFVDHASGFALHYLMRSKDESVKMLKLFIKDCKVLGIKIARIQSDRGTEYFEQEGVGDHYDLRKPHPFRATCQESNIEHTVTPVDERK